MRKELAEVVQFLGLDGGEGDEHTGGGSTLGAVWWDVFREGGGGGGLGCVSTPNRALLSVCNAKTRTACV